MVTVARCLRYLATPLLLAAAVLYLDAYLSSRPAVEMVASETALETLLQGDHFLVFGLFNSLVCAKCMTLFTKMQAGFQRDAQLSHYPFRFTAIDRAMFAKRGQRLDYVSTANMVLFYSRKRMYFFPEFIRMAHSMSFRRRFHQEIVTEARRFLESQIKLLRRLETLEEVVAAVAKEGVIAVFMGGDGVQFRAFRELAAEHLELPLFYIDDLELREEVMVFYAGFWTELSDTIGVFKRTDKLSYLDPDAYGLVPWDPSPSRLLRRLLIEMSPRLQVDPPQEYFLKAAYSGVPMVFFVESPHGDPQRTAKVKAWFDLIQLTERTFASCILSSGSHILRMNEALAVLTTISEDGVYVLTNPGRDNLRHAHLRKVNGNFTGDNLAYQVETILFNERMAPVVEPDHVTLSPKAMETLKNFLLGKSFDLPKPSDL